MGNVATYSIAFQCVVLYDLCFTLPQAVPVHQLRSMLPIPGALQDHRQVELPGVNQHNCKYLPLFFLLPLPPELFSIFFTNSSKNVPKFNIRYLHSLLGLVGISVEDFLGGQKSFDTWYIWMSLRESARLPRSEDTQVFFLSKFSVFQNGNPAKSSVLQIISYLQ